MKAKTRATGFVVLAVSLLALAGCSRVQEPWVPSKSYLQNERDRTADEQQQLRERLLYNQTDRTGNREITRTS